MRFWLFYPSVLLLCLIKYGVWYSPQTDGLLLISKDIFRNPFVAQPTNQWLLSSFLGPLLGYLTATNRSLFLYSLLHFVIFILAFTALIIMVRHQNGDFVARSVLIAFFISPISNVLFTWLGSPDVLTTMISMMIAVFWGNLAVLSLGAFLLGINHPEQGLVILVLLTVFYVFTRTKPSPVKFAGMGLGSLLLGFVLVQVWFASHNFGIVFSRVGYIASLGISHYVRATSARPLTLLLSLYGILTVFLVVYVSRFWRRERTVFAFVIYSFLALIVVIFTLDQTRVYAILTFPAILLLMFSPTFRGLEVREKELFRDILAISFLAGIVVPRFIVWDGIVYSSANQHLIAFLRDHLGALLIR